MNSKCNIYGVSQCITDGFLDISNALEGATGKEKRDLFAFAMEAVTDTSDNVTFSTRAKLVQKLYEKTIATAKIDFGSIPQSGGNITKLSDYKIMEDIIDRINELTEYPKKNINVESLVMMNKLYELLISNRENFEWGFKTENDTIKIIYNTGVMTLFQLININIVIYIDFLKGNYATLAMAANKKRSSDYIITSAKDFINIFIKGEFNAIVKEYKKNFRVGAMEFSSLSEEEQLKDAEKILEAGFFNSSLSNAAIGIGAKSIIGGLRNIMFAHPVGAGIVITVAAIVGIFFAIRKLISVFYHASVKISDCTQQWSEFIQSTEKETDSDLTQKRKSNAFDKLNKIHNWIETKIFKASSMAQREEASVNRDLAYELNSLRNEPPSFGNEGLDNQDDDSSDSEIDFF